MPRTAPPPTARPVTGPPPSRRARFAPDVVLVACWLAAVVLTTTLTLAALPVDLGPAYRWQDGYPTWARSLLRWDANHYANIARDGYTEVIQPAFFPLYPLLTAGVRALGVPLGYAGLLVSWVATLAAVLALRGLARDHFGDDARAQRVVTAFLLAPGAFFLACFYTEALFCALAFAAFLHARRGQWFRSCLLLGFLTATRLPATVVVLAVFVEHLAQRGFRLRSLDRSVLWFALAPLGLVGYLLWCWRVLGDPLAFLHAYDHGWLYQRFDPDVAATAWRQAVRVGHLLTAPGPLDVAALYGSALGFGCWLFCLLVTVLGVRRVPVSCTVLSLGTLVLVALNSNFQAVNRYVLVLFPVLLVLAGSRRLAGEGRFTALLLPSGALMLASAVLFTHGVWAG